MSCSDDLNCGICVFYKQYLELLLNVPASSVWKILGITVLIVPLF